MKWGTNAENDVVFVGKENEKGQVMTSAWVKLTSFSPECRYSKEDEGKLKITMSISKEETKSEPDMKTVETVVTGREEGGSWISGWARILSLPLLCLLT